MVNHKRILQSWAISTGVLVVALGLSAGRSEGQIPAAAEPKTDASVYGLGVRPTDWQTPEEERLGFHLPPGFEVRLFASEPQIAKPLNMAFDARGQMWLTQSVEYPYPASDQAEASDAVMVLADTDGDGRADRVTRFADRLNIPIGVLPYGDGCLCFSIPNIWYLRDTDGDGVCDRREVILGPFDTTRDTHGMINAMRWGGDGWVYACHGFNNQSVVTGRDGHTVKMSSGNTFRFRPDGSRIEVVTHGQVNPFGMTEDDWGFRYSADCHSKPITQLIRDACYPSFGRPHDGLGFLPPMVDHLHGSTAISGILHFPPESSAVPLRDQMISGNVMTSRLNRNHVTFNGATASGRELPDFLTSDDPWFRPVDIQLGSDGHIYVADFYNKIIGHYEVPLDHPGRDRSSGRLWQIRYLGSNDDASTDGSPNRRAQPTSLVESLRSDNPTVRRLATQTGVVNADIASLMTDQSASGYARVASIQALWCAGKLDESHLAQAANDADSRVRVAALRLAGELDVVPPPIHAAALQALRSSDARVVQAAAESLGRFGDETDADALFSVLAAVDPNDPVLRQTLRIAVRELYRSSRPDSEIWDRPPEADFASIMLGLDRPEMVEGLLHYLDTHPDAANRDELLKHAAGHATGPMLGRCVELAQRLTDDRDAKFQLLQVLTESQNARPGRVPAPLLDWATELVTSELDRFEHLATGSTVVAWSAGDDGLWPLRSRKLASGPSVLLVDSIGRSESYTGKLLSDAFAAPDEIRFWLAGHNGFPQRQDHRKNQVRLIDASSGEILHTAYPPRNDVAQQVRWDTGALGGRPVRIQCVDGDSGTAYAWLAVGQFNPTWILSLQPGRALQVALEWIERLGLHSMQSRLVSYLGDGKLSRQLRIDVAATLASLRGRPSAAVLLQFLRHTNTGEELEENVIAAATAAASEPLLESAQALAKELTSAQQRQFALAWVQAGADVGALLQMCSEGWVSPSALADVNVRQALTPKLAAAQLEELESLTRDVDGAAGQQQWLTRLQGLIGTLPANAENGSQVFKKNCEACHQLHGQGVVVGPQLDGAITRSPARLLEDIVTPDQNVDKAFRTTSFLLEDGRVVVGLVRSETDKEINLVDSAGKTITLDADSVEQRREAGRSLMPGNFGEVISPADFADMMEYIRRVPS
jgi:putative heme-binding domain-containing protein